ncbi:PLP-dependent aminotransferase family protein [Flavobacterium sp. P21]|uniref:MocR-like pyridoxine biosynthesis transcription factor PdxR n=1 Tax=Flavobacterium sp. P21 TaxID=3423948 RepID=UPI003D67C08E
MLRPWQFEIQLDKKSDKALYLQIADAVIIAIKSGNLTAGNALPGSRKLAELLNVNRNTVVEALDVLIAEGWLMSIDRKGTFIAELPTDLKATKPEKKSLLNKEEPKPYLVFDDGLPDSRLAPMNDLARAHREIFKRKSRWQIMGYSNELGDIEFRKAMVQMLNFKRGLNISSDQICITRGSQMAMYLASHCLFTKGDFVLVENPGYKPAWETFENAGATLLPVNVETDGANMEEVENYLKKYSTIKAIYVTPHHQFPTTVTMSLKKRLKLIELSNQYGFTIIEDDYDNEFHFGQRPILPISSYGSVQNFIYIGTLSKIIAPALRIGYLATSSANIEKVAKHRKIIDVQGDNIMEEAVLTLINEGQIKRHLKKAHLIYKAKRDYFESLCQQHLQEKITYIKPEGGLAFWIVPKSDIDLESVCENLYSKGIKIMSPEKFSFKTPIHGLRLGYASLTENQMEEGIIALSKLL